jgi:type II secretory pathway pseudopilin PulG
MPGSCVGRQRGFTYIGLLVAVVVLGLMLSVVGRVWTTAEQRERETQLLFVGHAYRMAIASYVSMGHQYPRTLQDLLTDERFPIPKHHLRRLYIDPTTARADWSLIMTPDGNGIMGVASSSQRAPIKQDGFDTIDSTFKGADCYCQWKFVYYANRWNRATVPTTVITGPPADGAGPSSPGSADSFKPDIESLIPASGNSGTPFHDSVAGSGSTESN